jgi:hypothetical protein
MNAQATVEVREVADQEIDYVVGGQGVIATSPLFVGNPNERFIGNPEERTFSFFTLSL